MTAEKKEPKPQVRLKLAKEDREAPVKVATSKQMMKAAVTVIPETVQVQVGPAWTHDSRFQLPPGASVTGPFMDDWNQRRAK